jgi:hypothetical protein
MNLETRDGIKEGIAANGKTVSDDPKTINKSQRWVSAPISFVKASGSGSPNKTTIGFV